jgi:hypothetical protein
VWIGFLRVYADSTLKAYCEYLSAYAVAFGVMERVKFRSRVVRISKCPSGGHFVSYVRKPVGSDQWNTGKSQSAIISTAVLLTISFSLQSRSLFTRRMWSSALASM